MKLNKKSIQINEKTKLKLRLFNTLKKIGLTQSQNILILKLLNTIFLKTTLTSKSTNRIVEQSFKKLSTEYKNESDQKNDVNPATLDETYHKTLFLNSLYQLLNLSN
jgi:hypothetical protein